jgi:hypothetical protein
VYGGEPWLFEYALTGKGHIRVLDIAYEEH